MEGLVRPCDPVLLGAGPRSEEWHRGAFLVSDLAGKFLSQCLVARPWLMVLGGAGRTLHGPSTCRAIDWEQWPTWSEPEWCFGIGPLCESWIGHNKHHIHAHSDSWVTSYQNTFDWWLTLWLYHQIYSHVSWTLVGDTTGHNWWTQTRIEMGELGMSGGGTCPLWISILMYPRED